MRAATNDQQWYVTISRGRKGIHIFTTDKTQLRENITRSGNRPLAVDLLRARVRDSWFFRLVERRWGERAAQIMELGRRARISKSLRQRASEHVGQAHAVRPAQTPKQSHGVGV